MKKDNVVLEIVNLKKYYGKVRGVEDVSLKINSGEVYGFIGPNGAGKSTFFKLVMGKLEPDSGRIILKPGTRIGFLPQVISDEIPSMEISVFDYLLDGRPIKKLEQELSEAYTEASIETDEKKLKFIMKRIGKLQEKLEYYEVYNAENILLKIVTGMNIDSAPFDLDDRLHLSITEPFSSRAVVFNELMDKVKNISYKAEDYSK